MSNYPHMQQGPRTGWAIVLAALMVWGCGADVDVAVIGTADAALLADGGGVVVGAGTDGGAVGGVNDGCSAIAAAVCEARLSCRPHYLQVDYGTLAVCVARETLRCHRLAAAVGAGGLTATVDACVKAVAAAPCDLVAPGALPRCTWRPGKRAAGAGCGADSQCIGLVCIKKGSGCGTCAGVAGLGEVCAVGQCAPTAACAAVAGVGPRCVAKRPIGGACNDNAVFESECAHGLWCRGGVCAAEATVPGGGCATSDGARCSHELGFTCDQNVETCVEAAMSPPGKSCNVTGISAGVVSECFDGRCLNQNDFGAGTCMAYVADGAACDSWEGPPCRPPARCRDKTCALPPDAACVP